MGNELGLQMGNTFGLQNNSPYFSAASEMDMPAAPPAPSAPKTLSEILSSPITGLAMSGVGLLSQGIGAWLNYRQQEKMRRDQKAYQREWMDLQRQLAAEDKRQFEIRIQQAERTFNLTRQQVLANIAQQKLENEKYVDATNYQRQNDWYAKMMNSINQAGAQNRLSQIYKQAA